MENLREIIMRQITNSWCWQCDFLFVNMRSIDLKVWGVKKLYIYIYECVFLYCVENYKSYSFVMVYIFMYISIVTKIENWIFFLFFNLSLLVVTSYILIFIQKRQVIYTFITIKRKCLHIYTCSNIFADISNQTLRK